MSAARLLIKQADVFGKGRCDVLIESGKIQQIAAKITEAAGLPVIDAAGSALCPGLKDHHIHLAAQAAAQQSIDCSPAAVPSEQALANKLTKSAASLDKTWLRGIGYHESIAGDIDAQWLDQVLPDRPIRIQHRGGRLWVFNSAALDALALQASDPLECMNGRLTGRLYEGDVWLRERMQMQGLSGYPDLSQVSKQLASFGVTSVTDTTPANGNAEVGLLRASQERGELLQDLVLMGSAELDEQEEHLSASLRIGPRKFHLLESALPDIELVVAEIVRSHEAGRNVAFHCVTRVEALFALSALKEAGVMAGDRMEHASVTPPEVLDDIKALGLTVVTQPILVRERGDRYLQDVEADDLPWLYRLRSFLEAGVPLAFSSDAPFGGINPWAAMQAASDRLTASGKSLGEAEAVTPEQALRAYTGSLDSPGEGQLGLQAGQVADLCLLDKGWKAVLNQRASVSVRQTWRRGACIWLADSA